MIRRTISVGEDLWKQVQCKANRSDLSISSIIRMLLKMWVNGEIEIRA